MNRHLCPHCGKEGISALRKNCLGPANPTQCTECGGRVGVPYWSLATFLPLFIALVLSGVCWRCHPLVSFWLGALGAGAVVVLWSSYVPLIKR